MSLADVRARIDEIDDQIVELLARRQEQVAQAASHKRDAAEVKGADRRRQVMERLRERAEAVGLDPRVVTAVYTAMIDAFVALELREHGKLEGRGEG